MEKKRISIVIPTKNEADYIDRTIAQFEGFFEQFNLEIVVSDANSTDGTKEVVLGHAQRFGADRVKFVQAQGKQNIAIGRNLGASHANGDILFHMDADVLIPNKENFFPKVIAVFEKPKVVAATAPIWVYPEEATFVDKLYHFMMNSTIRNSFFFGVYLAKGECQLVRRSTFEKIEGYNETIVAGEDCNLFYRLHKEGKISYIHQLKVYHSPRRFREYGYIKLTMIYLREGLSLLFLRRSYVEEWKPVR